ncbi:HECT E3 ubiquitin ligase [Phytophthora megakarya]|uniref:HECT-type E3 ubiquitin transferase n=1 Tax=Phytophthora megakarya TaxID=4795 RepID=A0A225W1C3_9STRA|nr:HECT E3 ubiquitin ligase [Phytophthora megakarya]
MSGRRSQSLSDVSDDDEFLNAAFEEFEEQDALDRELTRSSDASSSDARPSRRSNAARMLEALEALSTETEGESVSQSLRGLLQQLHSADGAVLGGMLPFSQLLSAGNAPRFQRMLEQIGADQPVHTQMTGLSELCETLSLSTEEALAVSGFSVDHFVPAIVTLIRLPPSMDVLLLAARALSTVLELYPSAAIQKATAEIVIPSLCEKLLEIEYMDVAELALQILEKIVCKAESALTASSVPNMTQLCAQYRVEVIQENGIVALLQFVDFFPLEIQRRAARIVCHLGTDFPLTMESKLRQGLPYITNLLRSFDSEILQSSCTCLQKLGESTAFSENSEFASMVATEEICGLLLTKLTSAAIDLEQLTQHIKVHVLIEETKPAAEPDHEDQSTQNAESHEEEESNESSLRSKKKTPSKRNSYKSNKRTVHDTVVLVEPLARVETIEDFIADKLFGRGGIGKTIIDELEDAGGETEEGEVDESGEFANDVVKPRRVVAVYKVSKCGVLCSSLFVW